jgi:hypothetical protein
MGHGPTEEQQRALLNVLARRLDEALNPGTAKGEARRFGFALLTWRIDQDTRGQTQVEYIGNATWSDVLVAFREIIARAEGRHVKPPGPQ